MDSKCGTSLAHLNTMQNTPNSFQLLLTLATGASEIEEESAPRATQKQKHDKLERPSIVDITTIIRKVRREFDRIKSRQTVALDDAITACASSIAAETRGLKVRQEVPKFCAPQALLEADASIQNEIKLLMQTRTVDRSALDQYLRSIRSSCDSLKNAKQRESMTSLRINLEQWQSLIQSAWSQYCLAQKNYI